jgi:DEAD/DEAH box helicase
MTQQPRHLHRLFAFLDPLLRRPTLVVEPYHRPAGQVQIRDNEAHSREQLALVMLHFGHHPAGLLPTRCQVEKAFVFDQGSDTGPSHRTRHQLGDVPFQVLVGRNADGVVYIPLFERLVDFGFGKGTSCLDQGLLWLDPLIQLNPNFEFAGSVEAMSAEGILHPECARVFRAKKLEGVGKTLQLYRHQATAIQKAREGRNYVLTTGTGSGKSLAYIIPIVDRVIRDGSGKGIQAIVVYPMNALANSQLGELQKFLCVGYADGKGPVTFARYTGQEDDVERKRIVANPPDILLTNYVMLELILTRPYESGLIKAAQGLQFLVLDELHTYRGRQGADVALLVRR